MLSYPPQCRGNTYEREYGTVMRGSTQATKERIVQSAYELFCRRGYARASVDVIAQKSGLTKRTLYYHFRSKDDLLASVFELHRGLALKRLADWADTLSGDVDRLLDGLFTDLASWASQPRWTGAGFTRVVMELADLPGHPARAIARLHKAEIEAWIATQLAEHGIPDSAGRAQQVMLLLEGCLSLLLIHGNKGCTDAATAAARQLVRGEAHEAPAGRRLSATVG